MGLFPATPSPIPGTMSGTATAAVNALAKLAEGDNQGALNALAELASGRDPNTGANFASANKPIAQRGGKRSGGGGGGAAKKPVTKHGAAKAKKHKKPVAQRGGGGAAKSQKDMVLEFVRGAGPDGVSGFNFRKLFWEKFEVLLELPEGVKLGKYLKSITGLKLRNPHNPHMSVHVAEHYDFDDESEDPSQQKANLHKLVQKAGEEGIPMSQLGKCYQSTFIKRMVRPKNMKLGEYLTSIGLEVFHPVPGKSHTSVRAPQDGSDDEYSSDDEDDSDDSETADEADRANDALGID